MEPLNQEINWNAAHVSHEKIIRRVTNVIYEDIVDKLQRQVEDRCDLIDGEAIWLREALLIYLYERGF